MIDEVLKIVNKFVPDKSLQEQAEIELRKLDIQEIREKVDYVKVLNEYTRFVLPGFLLALLCMFVINYLLDVIYSILAKEAPIIPINEKLYEFCKWFVGFLFGKKTIEKFSKGGDK